MTLNPTTFKSAMSCFASGVTVITTSYQEQLHGMTASSFCSLSLEPPLVLVCVANQARSHAMISKSGVFAVNILDADQLEWGKRFAGMLPGIEDRFAGIAYKVALTDSPILPGTLSWVDCKLRHSYQGGDHTIFVGEVVAGGVREAGEPLLYFNRAWHEPAAIKEVVAA